MTTTTGPIAPRPAEHRVLDGPLHRFRLANGLRVLLAPDHSAPVVSVAVLYDVGYRSEPPGREGFAHLFEHLMFQGSENLEKLAHARHIQACGGSFNGTTHSDHTAYFQVLPASGLELALFLEADRMRAPTFTAAGLANQVAVVEQEVRRKLLDNPYGGLLSPYLPAVVFDDFATAHDGWGDVDKLRDVTVAQCQAFFEQYYAPANALLVVCGDAAPDQVATLADQYFGPIAARPVPSIPARAAPAARRDDRHHAHHHPGAVMPALAVGWHLPPTLPRAGLQPATLLLAELLAGRPDAVLPERLIRRGRSASQIAIVAGFGGRPFESRDPDLLALTAVLTPGADPGAILDAVGQQLTTLAAGGPDPRLLARTVRTWTTSWVRSLDPLGVRAPRLGAFELLHGGAELALDLPRRTAAVGTDDVSRAATELTAQPRRWITISSEPAQASGSDQTSGTDQT